MGLWRATEPLKGKVASKQPLFTYSGAFLYAFIREKLTNHLALVNF
jgi:hypothetical protein